MVKSCRMLSRVNGQKEGTVSLAMPYYWETELARVSPLVLWVSEGGISHSFRRWGSLCNLIGLSSFGLVKNALICCKTRFSSSSLEGWRKRMVAMHNIRSEAQREGIDKNLPSYQKTLAIQSYPSSSFLTTLLPRCARKTKKRLEKLYLRGGICPHVVRNCHVWVSIQSHFTAKLSSSLL